MLSTKEAAMFTGAGAQVAYVDTRTRRMTRVEGTPRTTKFLLKT